MRHTILLYCHGVDSVLEGSSKVAGIQVQMSFWARAFVGRGWKVFSFTHDKARTVNGIDFLGTRQTWMDRGRLSIISELFFSAGIIRRISPDVVFVRGAQRTLLALSLWCRIYGAKLVFLSASDSDFIPGRELIAGSRINARMYRKSLRRVDTIIVQNQFQADSLMRCYGKRSLVLGNIWMTDGKSANPDRKYDAIWVANLRPLKRVEWFVNLARKCPGLRFAVVGGAKDDDYYARVLALMAGASNLDYLGAMPLDDVTSLIGGSRFLVCTSEFEGFPNTFLQAWSGDVPVISTVDPSGVIGRFGLGRYVQDEDELCRQFLALSADDEAYSAFKANINAYFLEHHDVGLACRKVLEYIGLS